MNAHDNANLVFDDHWQSINSAVYVLGQEVVVHTLHALADLIETSEFTFKADSIH